MLLTVAAFAADAQPRATVLVVVGAPGTEEYGQEFASWTTRWQKAAEQGRAQCATIGLDESGEKSDRELLAERIAEHAISSPQALWLVLIGHGTFDGKTARFNLRGPDVTPDELGKWLGKADRPLAIVNCASGSAPFLAKLTGNNRVVISATKSGFEYNFARFGDYLSAAIADPKADLDKDDQTSLLEAFLQASSGVKEFYAADGRLETEHALLDDNGDGLGTPADWFQGVRAVKTAKDGAAPDGTLAQQFCLVPSQREQELPPDVRARRDALEQELAAIRQKKGELPEADYLELLEPVLVQIARVYETQSADPAARPLVAAGDDDGFTPLFDGKSLTGWEGNEKMFRVEEGAIVAGSQTERIPHNEFLCTKEEFGDFELRLEARLVGKGDNAGVQFRSQRVPNHHEVSGYQCDIGRMQERPIWGWLYDESRRKKFLVEADAQKLAKVVKQDDWNELVIRCQGPRVQIWVNGLQTVDYTEKEAGIADKGIIGLQIHGGEPAEASYRKIRIKKL